MTLLTTSRRNDYAGNGTTGPFPYAFPILSASDLLVRTWDADDTATTLVLGTDYSVDGVGAASGSITLVAPLAVGLLMSVERERAYTQDTDVRNHGAFFPETNERAWDKIVMQVQQLRDKIRNAFTPPESFAPGSVTTTIRNFVAGNYLRVNLLGNGLEGITTVVADQQFIQSGTGAVVRSANTKMGERVSVKDFGAVGDGVTDDAVAIQRALNYVYAVGGGIVDVPLGKYAVTLALHMYQSVALIGAGGGKEDHSGGGGGGQTGTQFIFTPATPQQFLLAERDPSGINPSAATNAVCQGFGVRNTGPSGSSGIYFKNATFLCRDVWVENFAGGKGFRVVGAINSAFEQCMSFFNGWGLYMDPAPGNLSTTVSARGLYCASNTVNYVIQNVLGFNADDQTISESPVTDGWQIDNARRVTLARIYNENIAGYVLRVGGQNNGTTTDLVVEEFTFEDGASNDITKDAIYLQHADGVVIRVKNPPPERASFVRADNTVDNLKVSAPYGATESNQRATPGSARANSHTYAKGDIFTANDADSVQWTFIVTVAGTTAGSQPAGYAFDTLNLVDGTAQVSRYTTKLERPVIDGSLQQRSPWCDEHVRRVIGAGTKYSSNGVEFEVSGWGSGVTATCKGRDTNGRLSLIAGTSIPGANPTIHLTKFLDGPWPDEPTMIVSRGDVALPDAGEWRVTDLTTTEATITFLGTPVTGNEYVLRWLVQGT